MKFKHLMFLFLLTFTGCSTKALAHGVQLQYRTSQAIEIKATYDGQQPMVNAQVVVYGPDDPTKVWMRGMTDDLGNFSFTPDPSQLGHWSVKIHQAGHGDIITIPVAQENTDTPVNISKAQSPFPLSNGYTPMQKILMTAMGVWGFLGTALFFYRSK